VSTRLTRLAKRVRHEPDPIINRVVTRDPNTTRQTRLINVSPVYPTRNIHNSNPQPCHPVTFIIPIHCSMIPHPAIHCFNSPLRQTEPKNLKKRHTQKTFHKYFFFFKKKDGRIRGNRKKVPWKWKEMVRKEKPQA